MGKRLLHKFRADYEALVFKLQDAGVEQWTNEKHLMHQFVVRLTPILRKEVLAHSFDIDGKGVLRKAKTWEECARVCQEHLQI